MTLRTMIGFCLYYFTKHIARNDPLGSPRQVMGMGGFTLIELLVVVAIVGVLATIALSSYVSYQQRAVDQQMINDLKNVTFAMESYFAEHHTYTSFVPDLVAEGLRQSSSVTPTITLISAGTYTMTASKPNGTKPSFSYDSTTGIIQ